VTEVDKTLLEVRENLLEGGNRILFGGVDRAQVDSLSGGLQKVNSYI
jgi:hypothetical protein